jgi:ABC-2 type transport system permease protein
LIKTQILAPEKPAAGESDSDSSEEQSSSDYVVELNTTPTEGERALLRDRVARGEIDAYLWMTDDAIDAGKVTLSGRDSGGLLERSWFSDHLQRALLERELLNHGVGEAQVSRLLKPVKVEKVRILAGQETASDDRGTFYAIFGMVMLLYTAVIFYGVSVMRSVLEERNSRIMEVLLSSTTSTELMAGKLLGVGAVGLTQIIIWIAIALGFALPTLAANEAFCKIHLSTLSMVAFALFFLLGYLLYSSVYAAIGAIITTEQEGQQLQFIIVLPLIISLVMMGSVLRAPDSPMAVWSSMVPFLSPILMYLRIASQTPPLWQIVLSLALLTGTIALMLWLCARIYRIGALMYGKRPTLPEIAKWLKYARA